MCEKTKASCMSSNDYMRLSELGRARKRRHGGLTANDLSASCAFGADMGRQVRDGWNMFIAHIPLNEHLEQLTKKDKCRTHGVVSSLSKRLSSFLVSIFASSRYLRSGIRDGDIVTSYFLDDPKKS